MSKKAGWPKSHPVHSPENRTGQAWKQVFVDEVKEDRHGHIRPIKTPTGHFKCHCGAIVRIDEHGNAACVSCGEIFNDVVKDHNPVGISNRAKKRAMDKLKYDCVHTTV